MLKEAIGRRVRFLRMTKARVSQADFAKLIKVDRAYLSRLELGKQNVTITNLNLICNALGITLREFFKTFTFEIFDDEKDDKEDEVYIEDNQSI